jgi:parallel beta-helix repeat protein
MSLGWAVLVIAAYLTPLEALAGTDTAKRCPEPAPTSVIVNVKSKGAKGDGQADDTAAIQAAIDSAAIGGTVLVPDGTYMVSTLPRETVRLKSDMILKLAPRAVLTAIPSNQKRVALLRISSASNVTVVGGMLQGQRNKLQEAPGLGMGIRIDNGSSKISILNVTANDMWGDGFYIEDASDVTLCGVTASNNRRQGLSIIQGDNILVKNALFQNTNGARPGAGVDLEPDERGQAIANIRIQSSRFLDNAGPGILINGKKGPVSNVEITRNVFRTQQPILVRDATSPLSSAVCGNRYIQYVVEPGGLYAFADPVELSASDFQLTKLTRAKATAPCGTSKGTQSRSNAPRQN